MELEAYKAELARMILMSDSRQLLDKVKQVFLNEAPTTADVVMENEVEYKTKAEMTADLQEMCKEIKLAREGKLKGKPAEELINDIL